MDDRLLQYFIDHVNRRADQQDKMLDTRFHEVLHKLELVEAEFDKEQAKQDKFAKEICDDVRMLRDFRNRQLGIVVGISSVVSVLIWVLQFILKI